MLFLYIYSPSCGYCQKLNPEYEALAKNDTNGVVFGKLDGTQSQELSAKYKVTSFPTLLLFLGYDLPIPYIG